MIPRGARWRRWWPIAVRAAPDLHASQASYSRDSLNQQSCQSKSNQQATYTERDINAVPPYVFIYVYIYVSIIRARQKVAVRHSGWFGSVLAMVGTWHAGLAPIVLAAATLTMIEAHGQ